MRRKWKFDYQIIAIRTGAENKLAFYSSRLDFWKNKRTEVEKAIKESGLVIDESLTDTLSNINYGRGSSVKIDDKLARDFKECFDKIREHESNVHEYNAWIQLLAARIVDNIRYDFPESSLKPYDAWNPGIVNKIGKKTVFQLETFDYQDIEI